MASKITHFYSDPHFGHAKIIEYTCRSFSNVVEMDTTLITRYNETVGPDDYCMWLGDAFFYMDKEEATAFLANLNGRKGLILGNHDKSRTKMLDVGFSWVSKSLRIDLVGRDVRLHHYPYGNGPRNPKRRSGEVLLHGHTHSRWQDGKNMINLCVEAWDYRPVARSVVEELVKQLPRV